MSDQRQRRAVTMVIACAIVAVALFLIPAWIVQPFRAQVQDQLAAALLIRRVAPVATLLLLATGVASVIYARPRRWAAVLAGVSIFLLVLAAAAVRINYFELMFHPNPSPQFIAVRNADVDLDDMVLVARIGHEAHAYPVRTMAYHHLVNDTVGGIPIVPTY